MICSWCGQKLGFLRAFSDPEYCSDEHRKQEHDHMRRLAIERLTNASIAAAAPPERSNQPQPEVASTDQLSLAFESPEN